MDDFDSPDTKPGYCPVCGRPANIWLAVAHKWCCTFCNWEGRITDQQEKRHD